MIDAGTTTTFNWILGWAIALLILSLINTTRFGHVVLYYSLALMLFVTIITQYQFIGRTVGSIGRVQPV